MRNGEKRSVSKFEQFSKKATNAMAQIKLLQFWQNEEFIPLKNMC